MTAGGQRSPLSAGCDVGAVDLSYRTEESPFQEAWMHNDGNVVPLHKAATDQASPSPLARLPVILLQVRDKAAQLLRHGLQAPFDNSTLTLLEALDHPRHDV